MKELTIKVKIYGFNELSVMAKEKALEPFRFLTSKHWGADTDDKIIAYILWAGYYFYDNGDEAKVQEYQGAEMLNIGTRLYPI